MKESDKLCGHLHSLGIQAEILSEHPLENAGVVWDVLRQFERESRGFVQVLDKHISYINVIRESTRGDVPSEVGRSLVYLVPLKEIPSSLCWAVLITEKRGLLRRKVIDIKWHGGTLSETLNSDPALKQKLLTEFQLTSSLDVVIAPEPIYECMRIETPYHLPSGNLFDCLDRVAGHIPQHVNEVNSRPETVLLEAKLEFNPRTKDAEIADCCVTDRHLRINSKGPLQIPLYNVYDSYIGLAEQTYEGSKPVSYSMVELKYFDDELGDIRNVEFKMQTGTASSLRDALVKSYRYGISR